MFTGLIEDVGTVVEVKRQGAGRALRIRTSIPLAEVSEGDSIAVDGACLTAERMSADTFDVVAGRETLQHTSLDAVRAGRRVHLERALRVGDRLGGHLVQGHVDGVGAVVSLRPAQESVVLWVELPRELSRYVASKGSICVDGVSLTVNEVRGQQFRVNLVPHTAKVTRLGSYRPADRVNLEVDVLAKYVEQLLGKQQGGLTPEKLRQFGFEW